VGFRLAEKKGKKKLKDSIVGRGFEEVQKRH
jgi:hypothetical protein